MIDGRIRIDTGNEIEMEDERFRLQHEELTKKARELSEELKKPVIRVEVEYPTERLKGKSWEKSGDALEIDFTFSDEPTFTTLPPYSEEAP